MLAVKSNSKNDNKKKSSFFNLFEIYIDSYTTSILGLSTGNCLIIVTDKFNTTLIQIRYLPIKNPVNSSTTSTSIRISPSSPVINYVSLNI